MPQSRSVPRTAGAAGAPSAHPSIALGSPQALVLEQAAQGSGPPDLRMQYLRQIQANHEVSHNGGPHPAECYTAGTPISSPVFISLTDAAEGGADPA